MQEFNPYQSPDSDLSRSRLDDKDSNKKRNRFAEIGFVFSCLGILGLESPYVGLDVAIVQLLLILVGTTLGLILSLIACLYSPKRLAIWGVLLALYVVVNWAENLFR